MIDTRERSFVRATTSSPAGLLTNYVGVREELRVVLEQSCGESLIDLSALFTRHYRVEREGIEVAFDFYREIIEVLEFLVERRCSTELFKSLEARSEGSCCLSEETSVDRCEKGFESLNAERVSRE